MKLAAHALHVAQGVGTAPPPPTRTCRSCSWLLVASAAALLWLLRTGRSFRLVCARRHTMAGQGRAIQRLQAGKSGKAVV